MEYKHDKPTYSAREVKDFLLWVLVEKKGINTEEEEADDLMFKYGFVYGGKRE
jgi:hypothetical protein